jgi:hypothetical protein
MRFYPRVFATLAALTSPLWCSPERALVGGIDSGGGMTFIAGYAALSSIGSVFSDAEAASESTSGLLHLLTPGNPPPADRDGNGMPDAWEALHGLNTKSGGITDDADEDGISDLDEYIFGTDPRRATSGLMVEFVMDPSKRGAGSIKFPTVPGRIYQVWSSPTLLPNSWTRLWASPGTGKPLRFETPAGGGTRFYKTTVTLFR